MKSHTGGAMSFTLGILNAKSQKQQLNVKSSTKAEVVSASDYLPCIIWVSKFMKEKTGENHVEKNHVINLLFYHYEG